GLGLRATHLWVDSTRDSCRPDRRNGAAGPKAGPCRRRAPRSSCRAPPRAGPRVPHQAAYEAARIGPGRPRTPDRSPGTNRLSGAPSDAPGRGSWAGRPGLSGEISREGRLEVALQLIARWKQEIKFDRPGLAVATTECSHRLRDNIIKCPLGLGVRSAG